LHLDGFAGVLQLLDGLALRRSGRDLRVERDVWKSRRSSFKIFDFALARRRGLMVPPPEHKVLTSNPARVWGGW
jgi:hypothetical protein